MIDYVLRLAKRFAVLVPGIVIAYFSVRDIFPIVDKRLPVAVAVLVTYILGAYVLIPAATRVVRIFFPAHHLPLYCVTPDGFASDPLNIAVVGSKRRLVRAMRAAGWHVADNHSLPNVFREVLSALFNRPYLTAPMSSLYLFGRKQDIGFEIPIPGERGHRHHVRFWATTYENNGQLTAKKIGWHQRKERLSGSDLLWVGAASRDVGFAVIKHNVQITHMIHPDTGSERDLIEKGLDEAGWLASSEDVRLGRPYKLTNRALGGHLRTDGVLRVIRLVNKT
ncbi:MAG TPA: LssY C-terminal domain-containing protein [Candidatus Saccharimonadales bacterium]|nr:LssY C-terminal domain-containing protein [Candidatus Saccharimonadales bacterium]